jgi:hypothetical protein
MAYPCVSATPRRNLSHTLLAGLAVWFAAVWLGVIPLAAQDAVQEMEEMKQIQLTDQHIRSFIAAQKDLQPLSSKLLEGGEKPDDALINELQAIATKNGFKDFEEMEVIGANISLVLDGLDPDTGDYIDPVGKMKLELANIEADDTIPEEDKKLVIEDLKQEIAAAKPLQFRDNIEVVRKFQSELETLVSDELGEAPEPPEAGEKR